MTVTFNGADNLVLHADVVGPWNGPPVLLLHGGGQTRHAWKRFGRALANEGFLGIAIDLRGHGRSGWSAKGRYRVDDYANDIRAVARQIGRPVGLVGASLGGLSAILAAGEQPAVTATALVLVDVTPEMSDAGRQGVLDFMDAHRGGFKDLGAAADAVSGYMPHRRRPADISGLQKNLRKADDGRLYWHWDPAFIENRRIGVDDAHPQRLYDAAKAAGVPTQLVRGGVSELVSSDHAAAFLKAVPRVEYVDIPGAAHMVAGDSNDVFSDCVVDFFVRQVAQ